MLADKHPAMFHFMVALTILVALFIGIIPIPTNYTMLRPELLCLLVIYWVISVPQHLGVSFAFTVGMAQGVAEHTVWGAHALALTIVAYICSNAYQRIISYSVWHQALWVCVLVGVHQIVVNWVQSLVGYHAPVPTLMASTVVSALLWPPLLLGLRRLRQRLRLV